MGYVLGILSLIIISYIRIWIINNFFQNPKTDKRTNISIAILSVLTVGLLFFYKDVLSVIGLASEYFADKITQRTILLFITYSTTFVIIINFINRNIFKNNIFRFIIIGVLLFAIISLGGLRAGINVLIMYYLISVYAEEFLKISVSKSLYSRNKSLDLIFLSILIGLGFSVVETLVYLVFSSSGDAQLGLSISRGVFTSLLHIVSTGLIAYFIMKKAVKNIRTVNIVIGLLLGFGLHIIYNLSLQYNIHILSVLIIISCYFILSYLLFSSDTIYLPNNSKLIIQN